MEGTIHLDDLTFADAIARQNVLAYGLSSQGLKMNTYERQTIKTFMNIEYGSGATVDQLVTAYGYFGSVIDKIKASGYEVPKDLQTALDSTEKDLKDKLRDQRTRELNSLRLQREELLSADEKRTKLEEKIAKLEELIK